MAAHARVEPSYVPASELNRLLQLGVARADALEPKLVALLEPILRAAGDEAARRFEEMATDHLAAAAVITEADLYPAGMLCGDCERPFEIGDLYDTRPFDPAVPDVVMPVCAACLSLTAAAPAGWSPPAGDEIVDVDSIVSKLRTKTDPVRMKVVETMMTPILGGAGIAFDATNPLAAKVLSQAGSQVVGIADTTRLNVMRIVKASHEQGLTIPDTAKAIRAGMKSSSVARATLIARTEIVGAVNGGSLAATQIVSDATGVEYLKEWLTSPGAVYPRHEEYEGLDGQQVALDEYFDVGGDELQFPGDPDGSPEEVCNCRCTMVYTDSAGGEGEPAGGDAEEGFQTPSLPTGGTSSDAMAVEPMAKDDALEYYHSPKAFELNGALRDGKALTDEQASVVAGLDAQFTPAAEDMLLWRGVPDQAAVYGDSVTSKEVVSTRGYLSASTEKDSALEFASGIAAPGDEPVLEQIFVPKGTPILRVPAGDFGDQNEILLPRGLDRTVNGFQRTDDPYGHFDSGTLRVIRTDASYVDKGSAAPRPVTKLKVADDPYTASLQKELYSTGNKIGNLIRGKVRKGTATQADLDRLEALRVHEGNLKAWLEPPAPGVVADRSLAAEREFLLGELDQAERYYANDASTPHYVKLLKARLEQLDALEKDALPEPTVFPASKDLAADIAQIRSSAEFITPQEAAGRFREVLGTSASEPYRVPSDGTAPIPGYVKGQMHAVMAAGARMEDEIATMVARSNAAAGRRGIEDILNDIRRTDKQTADELRTSEAWADAEHEIHRLGGDLEDELAWSQHNSPFSLLNDADKEAIVTKVERDPRMEAARRAKYLAYDAMVAARKDANRIRNELQTEMRAARSGAAVVERNAIVNALNQVRDMGSNENVALKMTAHSEARYAADVVGETTGEVQAQQLLAAAQEYLPSEWIEKFNTFEASMSERGIHYPARDGVSRIHVDRQRGSISSDSTGFGTALHELVHEAEDVMPMIVEQERAFYEWRTRGGTWDGAQDAAKQLKEIYPGSGYGGMEFAREDKFASAYSGKHYVGQNNFELLTMGVQALMGGSSREVLDLEYRRWVLGMLALL